MSVTPLGNIHFINQNAPVAAAVNANSQTRFDLANAIANELADEQEQEVTQVRPTEETYKVDPEHQHEKNRSEQEQAQVEVEAKSENVDDDNEDDEAAPEERRLVDIKI